MGTRCSSERNHGSCIRDSSHECNPRAAGGRNPQISLSNPPRSPQLHPCNTTNRMYDTVFYAQPVNVHRVLTPLPIMMHRMNTNVCTGCGKDFGIRSDNLNRHIRVCRGPQARGRGLECPTCRVWVPGTRWNLRRHQERSGCHDEVDQILRPAIAAEQRRANNAERQRNRRRRLRGLGVPIVNEPRMTHDATSDGDAPQDATMTNTPAEDIGDNHPDEINIHDIFFGADMSDAALEELIAYHEEIEPSVGPDDEDEPEVEFEPAREHEPGASNILGDGPEPDAHQPNQNGPDRANDTHSEAAIPTCVVCLNDVEVDDEVWKCDKCSLKLHLDCARGYRASDISAKCPICKAELDIDEDVVIIGSVAPPRRCVVCEEIAHGTGLYMDGPNCDHRCHYECLHEFNGINFNKFNSADLQCPACLRPFRVPDLRRAEGFGFDNGSPEQHLTGGNGDGNDEDDDDDDDEDYIEDGEDEDEDDEEDEEDEE